MMAFCVILLMINNLRFDFRIERQNELILYDVSKNSVVDIFEGNTLYTLAFDSSDVKKIDFATSAYRIFNGNPKKITLESIPTFKNERIKIDSSGLFVYDNRVLYLVYKFEGQEKVPRYSDFLLVTHSTQVNPEKVLKYHSTKKIVLDSSIGYRMKQKWKKECEKQGIPVHDMYEDGIFRIKA